MSFTLQCRYFPPGLSKSWQKKKVPVSALFEIRNVNLSVFCVWQDGIDAIEDVIYHIETYDVTTIRASTPMFLMSRKIKSLGVKMVLSGEGSDEVFGGYLYFHKAPNKEEFHRETCHKV